MIEAIQAVHGLKDARHCVLGRTVRVILVEEPGG